MVNTIKWIRAEQQILFYFILYSILLYSLFILFY